MSASFKAKLSQLASHCVIIRARGHREVMLLERGGLRQLALNTANRKDAVVHQTPAKRQAVIMTVGRFETKEYMLQNSSLLRRIKYKILYPVTR